MKRDCECLLGRRGCLLIGFTQPSARKCRQRDIIMSMADSKEEDAVGSPWQCVRITAAAVESMKERSIADHHACSRMVEEAWERAPRLGCGVTAWQTLVPQPMLWVVAAETKLADRHMDDVAAAVLRATHAHGVSRYAVNLHTTFLSTDGLQDLLRLLQDPACTWLVCYACDFDERDYGAWRQSLSQADVKVVERKLIRFPRWFWRGGSAAYLKCTSVTEREVLTSFYTTVPDDVLSGHGAMCRMP